MTLRAIAYTPPRLGPHCRPTKGSPRARAFTLVETVLSIAVLSIIMGALMSTMLLATRAIPGSDDPGLASADIGAAFEYIMADVMVATEVSTDGTSLKLTVPDRTGDGISELVSYSLKIPSSPPTELCLTTNSGEPQILVSRVSAFSASIVSFDGQYKYIIIELATPRGRIHRAGFEMLARPEVSP